ncbi:MAG TPA: hypothetical protein PKD52_11065 [Clostridiales bacterium]|nr:hypothetical protein [Clostridiales bacterium]
MGFFMFFIDGLIWINDNLAEVLAFLGTAGLAVVTVYQNRTLKKQNKELREQTNRNIKRPYLDLESVSWFDSMYLHIGGVKTDPDVVPFSWNNENESFCSPSTNSGIYIKLRSIGEGEPVNSKAACSSDIKEAESDLPYEWYFTVGEIKQETALTYRISYQNIAGCKYHQDLKIEIKAKDEDISLEKAIKDDKILIYSVSLGEQVNDQ